MGFALRSLVVEGGLRIAGNQRLSCVVSHHKCCRRPGNRETKSQECFTNKAGAAYEEWALGGTGKLSTLQCVLDERALAESRGLGLSPSTILMP